MLKMVLYVCHELDRELDTRFVSIKLERQCHRNYDSVRNGS